MERKEAVKKRINESILLLFTFLFLMSLFSTSVLAADPGHSAGVIGANDFESGNYSFPDSVIVNYSAFFAALGEADETIIHLYKRKNSPLHYGATYER